jgi:hypothetical protein
VIRHSGLIGGFENDTMVLQTRTFLILIIILAGQRVDGQRFRMGFNPGVILSQLDGDGYTGYDKPGIRLGIRSQALISRKIDFILELNWEEKGSRFELVNGDKKLKKDQLVRLAYAEIPVIFRFYLGTRRAFFGEAGGAVSYLVKNQFINENTGEVLSRYQSVVSGFNRSELNAVLGGGYAFNGRLGCFFRTTIGISHLYLNHEAKSGLSQIPPDQRNQPETPLALLRNYLVSIGGYYLL